jgi:ketosteroid isomerase-like protein
VQLIEVREKAMKERDIKTVMAQFRDDATWINSQGFYFKNKTEIERFHTNLTHMDTVGYTYKAGKATVKILAPEFALIYYPWEMDWYKITSPKDTLKEIGLMSLTAQKGYNGWKWRAVTNQHTKEYFDDLETHVNKEMMK